MTPFKAPHGHVIHDVQIAVLLKLLTGSEHLTGVDVRCFLQDVLGVLLERLQLADVVVVHVARQASRVLLSEVLVDGHRPLVGHVQQKFGKTHCSVVPSFGFTVAKQIDDLFFFLHHAARAEYLVDITREEALVRVADEHDLFGRLERVVELKEGLVAAPCAAQTAKCTRGVDGDTGQVEDGRPVVLAVQDGEDPLPKAAGVFRNDAVDQVVFVIL